MQIVIFNDLGFDWILDWVMTLGHWLIMILGNWFKCYKKGLVNLTCNCTVKESCIQVVIFCVHHRASCFLSRIMLNMALLLCVVNEGEHMVVNQVVEEVNPSVEVGFDICGTSTELDFSVNQGKPQMHLNLPCVLQSYIAFAFKYCIKWLGVEWKPNWCITNLVTGLIRKCLVMLSHA